VSTVALSPTVKEVQEKPELTGLFLRAKEADVKPSSQEAQAMSPKAKWLLQIWDLLVMYQGQLY